MSAVDGYRHMHKVDLEVVVPEESVEMARRRLLDSVGGKSESEETCCV